MSPAVVSGRPAQLLSLWRSYVNPIRCLMRQSSDQRGCHVAVIGGGPTGAVMALRLAQAGLKVNLFEKRCQIRQKVDEGLTYSCISLLSWPGLSHLLREPGHLCQSSFQAAWGSDTLTEKDLLFNGHEEVVFLDRIKLEAALKRGAIDCGVQWHSGSSVAQAARDPWRDVWNIEMDDDQSFRADFLVLATGRRSPSWVDELTGGRVAYDHLVGVSRIVSTPAQACSDTRMLIEAESQGWWCTTPLIDGRLVVTLMTDIDLLRQRRRETPGSLIQPYDLPNFTRERSGWHNDHAASQPYVRRCGTSRAKEIWGESWIAVGDAAASYDPLSSYGITSAMEGSVYAANAILSKLSGEGDAVTMAPYGHLMGNVFGQCVNITKELYLREGRWPSSSFWERRHRPGWPFDSKPAADNSVNAFETGW